MHLGGRGLCQECILAFQLKPSCSNIYPGAGLSIGVGCEETTQMAGHGMINRELLSAIAVLRNIGLKLYLLGHYILWRVFWIRTSDGMTSHVCSNYCHAYSGLPKASWPVLTTTPTTTPGCKTLQEEVDKLKTELNQAQLIYLLPTSQLAAALKENKHSSSDLQLQLTANDEVLQERNTKDAERIQYLESQLSQMEQQLENLTDKQKMKTASSYNSQSYTLYQKATPGLCGLSNLGHSCYMNAALQCLNSAVPFREHFLHQFDGQDKVTGLAGAYKDLLTKMWSGAHQSLRAEQLAHEMAKICDYFDGKSSQDAQEFLGCLLENLHDNIKTAQAEPSIIAKLFEGLQKSSVVCTGCGDTATRDDPFMFLPIAIPEKQNA
eukprot:Em0005g202a